MTQLMNYSALPAHEGPISLVRENGILNPACEDCPVRDKTICDVLNDNEIQIMARNSIDLVRNGCQLLCTEGEPADYIFNIREGMVRLSKMLSDGRRQITGFLSEGDFFGMPSNQLYCYTAEAITDVKICRFPREKIFQSFEKMPKLGRRAFEMTRTELHWAHEHMLILGRKTALEKLSSFLLHMAQKKDISTDPESRIISLPMSRSDIADYLGLTVETISRQFSVLQKRKVIKLKDAHTVILSHPPALYDLSQGD